ncbi:MAG: hypothetical protein GY927_21390 [bacterium]|nr:hypothetical protein [bacterium]
MHEFYFHEDEVGQTQLLPVEWWDYCQGELEAIVKHSKAHLDPNAAGWTKMYEFAQADPNLPRLEMTEARFHELITPHCRRFDRLDNPLAAIDALHGIRAAGYGPPASGAGIIADLEVDKVRLLWGRFYAEDLAVGETLANMLTALCSDQHLLLVDWQDYSLVDCLDRAKLEAYLRED